MTVSVSFVSAEDFFFPVDRRSSALQLYTHCNTCFICLSITLSFPLDEHILFRYNAQRIKCSSGWLWCSGNTGVCGTLITGSIPVSHPKAHLQNTRISRVFLYEKTGILPVLFCAYLKIRLVDSLLMTASLSGHGCSLNS